MRTPSSVGNLHGKRRRQPANWFTEHEFSGEVLVEVQHAELKEIGLHSVGHRLTILKGVYEIKVKQNIPIEPDHYVPLCTAPCTRYKAIANS